MQIRASEVIGLKVVDLARGEETGEVKDLAYGAELKKVKALLANGEPDAKLKAIPYSAIKSFGKDAITIDSPAASGRPSLTGSKTNSQIKTMGVLTQGGTSLGQVADVIFEKETGKVEELEVSQGAVEDLRTGRKHLPVSEILKVGQDKIIVGNRVENKFKTQKGGLEKALERLS